MKRILILLLILGTTLPAAALTPAEATPRLFESHSADPSPFDTPSFAPKKAEKRSVLTDTLIRKTQPVKQHFLPTRRRIDREINKLKFAYKGR